MVPAETQARLQALAELPRWRALQGEFLVGNFACESRTAIIDLVPHRQLAGEKAGQGKPVPHITFHVDFRGLAPIGVAGFDAKAFITNVRDKHTQEILSKLAPHVA